MLLAKDAFTDRAEIFNQTKRLVKIQAVAEEVNVAQLQAQPFELVITNKGFG